MKNLSILIIVLLFCFSCSHKENDTKKDSTSGTNTDIKTKIDFVNLRHSAAYDSLFCDVKMTDESGNKTVIGSFNNKNITVIENGSDTADYPKVLAINGLHGKNIIGELSILVLMDISNSITVEQIGKQKDAILELLKLLPNNKIYLSTMDSTISKSQLISKIYQGDYPELNTIIKTAASERTNSPKFLYKAILAKIEELAGKKAVYYPNVKHEPSLEDSIPKILFILTDGKIKDKDGYLGGQNNFVDWKTELTVNIKEKIDKKEMRNIPIHCIYFGDQGDNLKAIKSEMEVICSTGGKNDMKGKFHTVFQADSILQAISGTIKDLSADYELVLLNKPGKKYRGDPKFLQLTIESSNKKKAFGEKQYTFGTTMAPIEVSGTTVSKTNWSNIGIGSIIGALFIIIVYLIMQFLVPYINYLTFKKKYVVPFRKLGSDASGNILLDKRCFHCKKKLESGDIIVNKCEHVVHLDCWEENRNRCPEYGGKCKTGIHYYNQKRLTDPRNSNHYLPWILYGLTGGILSWFFFKIFYSDTLFNGLISGMVNVFYPIAHKIEKVVDANILNQFQTKIRALLLTGLLLGFFLNFMFSYFIEYRKKTSKVLFELFVRALVSSLIGFLTFLIGAIIVILVGKSINCMWIDWVPWLFFASGMAFAVSFKTEISFKNAFIGGIISVIFSFIVLYFSTFAQDIIGMFSYMFYAAGLGVAIAVVHFISEKYFLHTEGQMKERDIAIYKWMNVHGGFNHVTIGKSIDCVIQINWDDEGEIADKQVELYLENDRPICKAMEEGVTLSNGRALKKGEIIHLTHGVAFIIANTKFSYIEKDK